MQYLLQAKHTKTSIIKSLLNSYINSELVLDKGSPGSALHFGTFLFTIIEIIMVYFTYYEGSIFFLYFMIPL